MLNYFNPPAPACQGPPGCVNRFNPVSCMISCILYPRYRILYPESSILDTGYWPTNQVNHLPLPADFGFWTNPDSQPAASQPAKQPASQRPAASRQRPAASSQPASCGSQQPASQQPRSAVRGRRQGAAPFRFAAPPQGLPGVLNWKAESA